MRRLNVLLLSSGAQVRKVVQRTLTKVFREHFLFELNTQEEAARLLQKLKIDLIIFDLDENAGFFQTFRNQFTSWQMIGIFTGRYEGEMPGPGSLVRLMRKEELEGELAAEFKGIRTAQTETLKNRQAALSSSPPTPNFKDFGVLSGTR